MHKKISFTVNTERNANVGDTFLTYSTNTMNELTLEGSPEGLALLAERLLAAAREGKAAAISFEDNPPVSPAYMKQKEEEAAEFLKKLPSMEVGKSYILTFMKDGKVRNLVVTPDEAGKTYHVIFEDHFVKYFLRHEEGRYVYVLSKSPSHRIIPLDGVKEAVRFFLQNHGDGQNGLEWKEGA